jgi:LysM repeat protein
VLRGFLRKNPGATKKNNPQRKLKQSNAQEIMNTANPLLPQGTLPPPGRSSLYFKILVVFAFHIVVLGGILMAGCNPSKTSSAHQDAFADTTPPQGSDVSTAPPGPQVPLPPAGGGATTPTGPTPPVYTGPSIPQPVPAVPTPTQAAGSHEATDYVIAEHDTFGALAKKFNVSLKAIEDANPGVDPKKLQPKQVVHIPASTAVAATTGPARAAGDTTPAVPGDTTTYTIKPGDVLTKIATAHNTTVKAIEALNGMKTATIYAGHTLKIPVTRVASSDTAPAPSVGPAAPSAPSAPSTSSTPAASGTPGAPAVRTF